MAETCHAENATQLITHVEVTPSSGSDTDVTVPLVDGLAERKVPTGRALRGHGVWVGPQRLRGLAPGDGTGEPGGGVGAGELPRRRGRRTAAAHWADFQIDVTGEQATVCPAGPGPSRSTSWRMRRSG